MNNELKEKVDQSLQENFYIQEKFWKLAPSEMYNEKFIDRRVEVEMK